MRLYHYLEAKWAMDDLERRRLKASKIDEMNDPYETDCVCSDDIVTQISLDKTTQQLRQTWAALCFSRRWDSILMWSHYADRHKGICLGFDVDDEIARPVEYVAAPKMVGNMMVADRADFKLDEGEAIVSRWLETKFVGWSYEEEVRVHVSRMEEDARTGHCFADFSEKCTLREVIVGDRCRIQRQQIEIALSDYSNWDSVEIKKVRHSSTSFRMLIKQSGF
jgi:hypothetical protein